MSSKENKKTVKPICLEHQIGSLEYHIKKVKKDHSRQFEPFVGIPMDIAEAILVTLKRLPKGVD